MLLRGARRRRHCEERSDEAISFAAAPGHPAVLLTLFAAGTPRNDSHSKTQAFAFRGVNGRNAAALSLRHPFGTE
jgi:hypothetical protein